MTLPLPGGIAIRRAAFLVVLILILMGQLLLTYNHLAFSIGYFLLIVLINLFFGRVGGLLAGMVLISNTLILITNLMFADCHCSSGDWETYQLIDRVVCINRCGLLLGLNNFFSRLGQLFIGLLWIASTPIPEMYDIFHFLRRLIPKKHRIWFKLNVLIILKFINSNRYDLLKAVQVLRLRGLDIKKFWRIYALSQIALAVLKLSIRNLLKMISEYYYFFLSYSALKAPGADGAGNDRVTALLQVDDGLVNAPVVRLANLSVSKKGGIPDKIELLLNTINLEIPAGRCIGVTGKDQAGKTSLLKVLAGYIPEVDLDNYILTGQYFFLGTAYNGPKDKSFFSMLANNSYLISNDLSDNFLGLKVKHELSCLTGDRRLATDALEKFGLHDFMERDIYTLSGGESIRFLFACAYLKDAALLLLDDITTQLDPEMRKFLASELMQLKSRGKTLLISGTDLRAFNDVIDETLLLEEGAIVGTIIPIRPDPSLLFIPHACSDAPILELWNVDIAVRSKTLLKNVCLKLHKRNIMVITGRNGSGKTSLADVIVGIRRPKKGKVRRKRGIRIAYVFQNVSLQTIENEVEAELLLGPYKSRLSSAEKEKYLNWSLNYTRLKARDETLDLHPSQQKLLQVAITSKSYDLIILDEPSINMDMDNKKRILEYISYGLMENMSFIIITHDDYLLKGINTNIYSTDYSTLQKKI